MLEAVAEDFPEGLSPRVRGNLIQRNAGAVRQGPIPACAGQPKTCAK